MFTFPHRTCDIEFKEWIQLHFHLNRRVHSSLYRKTKAFFPLNILQADLLTLDEVQIHQNSLYNNILLKSHFAYAVPFC